MLLDSEQAKDTMTSVISTFEKSDVDYGDIRFNQGTSRVVFKDKEEETIGSGSNFGFHLRVFKKGEWRSLGISEFEKTKIIESAKKLCNFSPFPKKISLTKIEDWNFHRELKPKKQAEMHEMIGMMRDIFKMTKSSSKKIVDVVSNTAVEDVEKIFMNTAGSNLFDRFPRTRYFVLAVSKEGPRIERDVAGKGAMQGYEFIDGQDWEKVCSETAKSATDLLKAENPPSGKNMVILDEDMSGLLAHESCGHGLEADQVLRNRAYFYQFFKKRVAPDMVSISDDSRYPEAYGSYSFDDEGTKSKKNMLVENGILKSFIHSIESASVLNATPTGNGRAQDFAHKVFVRMSNTYFEPGNWKFEEILEGVKKGLYLVGGSHGMEDPEGGGMQISSIKAYQIENGELKNILRGCTLTGNVVKLLMNIDAVSKSFDLRPGSCGKGHEDYVAVTSGGPHLRVKEAIVGAG